jgi:hypothetical protein
VIACENHRTPGQCDDECLWLAIAMEGDDGYGVPFDPTGCSYPPPMPYDVYALEDSTVVRHSIHPDGCMCSDEICPAEERC